MPIVQRQLDRPSHERTHPALNLTEFRRACCRSHERRKDYAALKKGAPWAGPVANHFIKKLKRYEICIFARLFVLGCIPGPDLIGSRCQKFRLLILRSLTASSSLFDIAMLGFEDSIHRADGTMVLPIIHKRGIQLITYLILKSLWMRGY